MWFEIITCSLLFWGWRGKRLFHLPSQRLPVYFLYSMSQAFELLIQNVFQTRFLPRRLYFSGSSKVCCNSRLDSHQGPESFRSGGPKHVEENNEKIKVCYLSAILKRRTDYMLKHILFQAQRQASGRTGLDGETIFDASLPSTSRIFLPKIVQRAFPLTCRWSNDNASRRRKFGLSLHFQRRGGVFSWRPKFGHWLYPKTESLEWYGGGQANE